VIIALLALAFLLDQRWLVLAVGLVMAAGTASSSLALFQRLYRDLLRPARLLAPDLRAEEATPHRFAQGLGAAVLGLASLALYAGALTLGWGLALLVVVLAGVNLFLGFCAGCFVFFQLQRLRGR
jgi:hypothetical protein